MVGDVLWARTTMYLHPAYEGRSNRCAVKTGT